MTTFRDVYSLPVKIGRRKAILTAVGAAMMAGGQARAQDQSTPKRAPDPTPQERAALDDLISTDLLNDPGSPILGNPNGDVSMVEFFDYRCPYCRVMAPRLVKLVGTDNGLRLVMKEYPILSRESIIAAKVALVASRHCKYAPFHAAMYRISGPFDEGKIFGVAQSIGLDPSAVQKEMSSDEVVGKLRRNLALGELIGVKGTPTFVIDGQIVPGAVSAPVLEKLIQADRYRQQSPGKGLRK